MNSQPLFSSPPRAAPRVFEMRHVSKSGGNAQGRMRRPEYKHLSSTSRTARTNEQPWRKRFREQCIDRLSKARDESFMMRRQLTQMSQRDDTSMHVDAQHHTLSEEEIYAVVQQEWARFQAEMEQQCLECGVLDVGVIGEIEEDLDWDHAHMRDHAQMQEHDEWEQYENQLLEDEMMEAELMEADSIFIDNEHDGTA
ncbi:hypothetical protein IW139_003887 [Coemansia sp. RSA 353]|nr:hypothetical protein EV181_007299 [Coemansia sp. RSA 532]KAJ2228479.1 hypothetical protein EV180_001967 [Coemansia sp. RSA 518]KAJ2250235.1 hypothetical protein GGH97_000844 [Coemansia sp. RSA 475]KAJ2272245.1 hypothetical protein J3F81_003137 [Coemansia sp. RSA 371]KAJ2295369.1 hypothetical protein IW139_003887 [Coemansia sp. RSA 353]KAJ2405914.1 hypothetical protein J3F80_003859 [Coemansia sp. RSA 2526]KAJ2588687.1 hypothetical protein IWW49_002861 [Coemansia sp. RSA 1797]